MKKEDLISIIIPVYNAEKFLNDTIKTIQDQTYNNWEAIFVDDCSIDNSIEIIKEASLNDKRIKLYRLNKNSGNPCFPRNYGIDRAKGKYLCFLDADDLWEKEKLEYQIKFMKQNKIAFSYTSYEYANERGIPTGKKVVAINKMTYKKCLRNNLISTITVMFDTSLIDKDIIKMPNIKFVEDTATWWKILRTGYIAYGINNVFSYYRIIPNSNSSNKIKTQKSLWYLYRYEEKLSIIVSLYCLFWKNIHAILRRI